MPDLPCHVVVAAPIKNEFAVCVRFSAPTADPMSNCPSSAPPTCTYGLSAMSQITGTFGSVATVIAGRLTGLAANTVVTFAPRLFA